MLMKLTPAVKLWVYSSSKIFFIETKIEKHVAGFLQTFQTEKVNNQRWEEVFDYKLIPNESIKSLAKL